MKDDDNHILLLEKGKRGLLQIIFGRTGIIIVSLIVQILFLFAAFYKLELVKGGKEKQDLHDQRNDDDARAAEDDLQKASFALF